MPRELIGPAATWHPECVRTVLLVEDDVRLAMATARTLRPFGYEVIIAFDVRTADHLLRERTFDLILCDLFLPPDSGLDVLDVVERAKIPAPFLITSGQRTDEFDWMLRKYPRITAFVPKPCSGEELVRILAAALPNSGS